MQTTQFQFTDETESKTVIETEHGLQRPPYLQLLGNQFIQQILRSTATAPNESVSGVEEIINKMPECELFSALPTVNPLGLSTIFKNRGWGVIEFIKALPHLPETFILELDALSSGYIGDSIEHLLPLGHGFHVQGFIDADLDCLHTSDEGVITIQRDREDAVLIENRHRHAAGFGATMGGKSDLFGRSWDTDLEGHVTAAAHVFEVYDFPIKNPLLLLPLMKAHGVFDFDLTNELLNVIAPNGYKSYRRSVTYGLENQADALAEYNVEHPKLIDICLAFGIDSQAGFELHLPKKEGAEPQKYELTVAAGVGFSTESAMLFAQNYGIPVEFFQQAAELGARISGCWDQQPGKDKITVERFDILACHNPMSDYEMQQPPSTEVSLSWAIQNKNILPEEGFQWPTELRISLIRDLEMAFRGNKLSPEIIPLLEDIGVELNSQAQLSMTLVIPKDSLVSLWKTIEGAAQSPSEFLSSLQRKFINEHNDILTRRQISILLENAHFTAARLRCIIQSSTEASLKAGLIAGVGFKSSAAIGSFKEVDLLGTNAVPPLTESLIGLG